jgi:hypothetical protein
MCFRNLIANVLKCAYVFLFAALCAAPAKGQDIIVTNDGDTLNCKISEVKDGIVYFEFVYNGTVSNTSLPKARVAHYQYSYFQPRDNNEAKAASESIKSRFRFSVNGGRSHLLPISNYLSSHYINKLEPAGNNNLAPLNINDNNPLKSGYNYGLDITHFFIENLGIGFRYSNYVSANKIKNTWFTNSKGAKQKGDISEKISINFIGPFFVLSDILSI